MPARGTDIEAGASRNPFLDPHDLNHFAPVQSRTRPLSPYFKGERVRVRGGGSL